MESLEVKLKLEGLDGNAFSLLGAFKSAARRQHKDNLLIAKVMEDAMSGDYDHLLQTLIYHTKD